MKKWGQFIVCHGGSLDRVGVDCDTGMYAEWDTREEAQADLDEHLADPEVKAMGYTKHDYVVREVEPGQEI